MSDVPERGKPDTMVMRVRSCVFIGAVISLAADQRPTKVTFDRIRIHPVRLVGAHGRAALRAVGGQLAAALACAETGDSRQRADLRAELGLQGSRFRLEPAAVQLARDVGEEHRRPARHAILQEQPQGGARVGQRRRAVAAVSVSVRGARMHIGGAARMVAVFQLARQARQQGRAFRRSPVCDQLVSSRENSHAIRTEWPHLISKKSHSSILQASGSVNH